MYYSMNSYYYDYNRVSFANIKGSKYTKGSILIYKFSHDDPLFGKVLDILVTSSGDCLFILAPLVVNTFNGHYNAYDVKLLSDEFIVCHQEDLADFHVLCLSRSFDTNLVNTTFICLKYNIVF